MANRGGRVFCGGPVEGVGVGAVGDDAADGVVGRDHLEDPLVDG